MLTQVKWVDIAGKTVARTYGTMAQLYVVFTDGTFAFAEASSSYDELELHERFYAHDDIHAERAVGIITDDEFQAIQNTRFRDQGDQERREYERLKAKYERLKAKYEQQ